MLEVFNKGKIIKPTKIKTSKLYIKLASFFLVILVVIVSKESLWQILKYLNN